MKFIILNKTVYAIDESTHRFLKADVEKLREAKARAKTPGDYLEEKTRMLGWKKWISENVAPVSRNADNLDAL